MKQKNHIFRFKIKIISFLLCLIVLITSLLTIIASASNATLKAKVTKALNEVKINNTFISDDVVNAVKSELGSDVNVSISEWYLSRAINSCKDATGILFEGYDGYASGIIKVSYENDSISLPFCLTIKPTMTTYSFQTIAKCDYFYPDPDSNGKYLRGDIEGRSGEYFLLADDGKTFFAYCGEAEKIVIPEGVTTLNQSWWLDTNLENVRCIILPDSLEILPDQFGVPFNKSLEVVIMGDNVKWAEGYHTFWRCFRLKHLRLSDNLENLPEEALFETINLTEVKLPSDLKIIGKGAFHLSAVRDITIPESVTEIAQEAFAWPIRKAQYLAVGVRTQGNAIPVDITTEADIYLSNKIFDSKGEIIPRSITILSKKVIYEELIKAFWTSDFSWATVNLKYIAGSTTEALIKGGYNPKSTNASLLDMTKGEVEGRVASAVSTVPIAKGTSEKTIEKYIEKQVYSKNIKSITVKNLKIKSATSKEEGSAKATVLVKYGNEQIEVRLDRKLKFNKPFTCGKEPLVNNNDSNNDIISNDYLDVEFSTDKASYESNEEIKVNIKVGNKTKFDLKNIKIVFGNDGLSLKKGSLTPMRFDLSASEQREANIVLVKTISNDKTPSSDKGSSITSSGSSEILTESNDASFEEDMGVSGDNYSDDTSSVDSNLNNSSDSSEDMTESQVDNTSSISQSESSISENASNEDTSGKNKSKNNIWWVILIIVIVIACGSAIIILFVRKIKHRKIISVILSIVMCISVFSFSMINTTAVTERITVRNRITVDGERYTISAIIAFSPPEEPESNLDNNYTVDWNIN